MLMIIGGMLCVVSVALAMWFWNNIVEFLQNNFLPYVREKFGKKFADALTCVLVFIDDGMVLGRRCVKWTVNEVVQGWRWFKTHVLKIQTTYSKNPDGSYTAKRVSEIVTGVSGDQATVEVKTEIRTLPWSELPSEIRRPIIRGNASGVTINEKEIIEEKFKDCAEKKELDLSVSD